MTAQSPPLNAAPAGYSHTHGRTLRVLFVDDEPLIARLGEQFLKWHGYEAEIYTDPVKALEAFRTGEFDLVITDLSMPQIDGVELARRMRLERPFQRVILTSAYHHMLEGKDAHELGFCDFVSKPYSLNALKESMERVLAVEV